VVDDASASGQQVFYDTAKTERNRRRRNREITAILNAAISQAGAFDKHGIGVGHRLLPGYCCRMLFAGAFSSEVDTGSRKENALK
jgi:hypothetical protein